MVRDCRPDAFVLAGDIYDRAVPPKEAVRLLDDFLVRLIRDEGVPMLMIAGNHDSPERLSFGSRFLEDQKLFVAGRCAPTSAPVVIQDVAFHLLPFGDPATVRFDLAQDDIRSHQDALAAQASQAAAKHPDGLRSVAVAHAFVIGGLESESESTISVGGTGEVDAKTFQFFDYTALGHLHRPQAPSSQVRYAGSLLKYSASEADHRKSITLVELPSTGAVQTTALPFTPRRDLRRVRGLCQDLLAGSDPGNREDYVFVELLDRGPVVDAMARLRQIYPNLLGLHLQDLADGESGLSAVDHRSLDPEALFARFFEETMGEALSQEERGVYREILSETENGRCE